ncbi:MAG: beta-ketoacyl synthase [Lentisphaerae bacterium GWF2_52_8]|nr:MAG: beta-ketoacyl synthase [Lentisphaerae bacterium GWF2_52_8]
MRRVVISGYGSNTALGLDSDAVFAALMANHSGVVFMPEMDRYSGLNCRIGAPVTGFDAKSIPRQQRRSMGRMSIFAALAAREACARSAVQVERLASPRTGCIMGSTMGSATEMEAAFKTIIETGNLGEISSMQFFKCVSHTAAMNTAQFLGISGFVMSPAAACASAMQAIGLGFHLIRTGVLDMAFCGGAEEVNIMVCGSFDCLFAASTNFNGNPSASPRPFDAARDGVVCGEGAGVLVLESLESALSRNAPIFAEIAGYNSCGSGSNVSQSDTAAIGLCMRQALLDAKTEPGEVDYISAHATGTLQGDAAEAAAIQALLGARTPVSSLKGYFGHTLGASGAVELIAALQMMRDEMIIPTRNLERIAEDCGGIRHVQKTERCNIRCLVKNCFAFGGINAVLLCRRYER